MKNTLNINSNFYIATLDAGYSIHTKKEFKTFHELIFGEWHGIKAGELENDYIKGVEMADLISRIFDLTDILSNTRNVGFVINQSTQAKKIKIIDFKLHDYYMYMENDVKNIQNIYLRPMLFCCGKLSAYFL